MVSMRHRVDRLVLLPEKAACGRYPVSRRARIRSIPIGVMLHHSANPGNLSRSRKQVSLSRRGVPRVRPRNATGRCQITCPGKRGPGIRNLPERIEQRTLRCILHGIFRRPAACNARSPAIRSSRHSGCPGPTGNSACIRNARSVCGHLTRTSPSGTGCGACNARRRNERIALQFIEERTEPQLPVDIGQHLEIGVLHRKSRRIELDRHIQLDGRQPFGQQYLFAQRLDVLALLSFELIGIFEQVLHGTELAHQFDRTLLADARHTRNIIRRIAPQREDVDHPARVVDTVMLADLFAADDLDSVSSLALLINAHGRTDQLPVILIRRHHVNFIPGPGSLHRQRADHIVGLVAGNLDHRNTHRLEHPLDVGHRRNDVLRSSLPVRLVLGINFMAEITALGVERDAQQARLLAADQIPQEFDEPENRRSIQPFGIAHRAADKSIISAENQRVGIDQEQSLHQQFGIGFERSCAMRTDVGPWRSGTGRLPVRLQRAAGHRPAQTAVRHTGLFPQVCRNRHFRRTGYPISIPYTASNPARL